MGISVYIQSPVNVHCSHHTFREFRKALMLAAGIDPNMFHLALCTKHSPWDGFDDPITILLKQPDTSAEISPEACGKCHDRLVELVHKAFPPTDKDPHNLNFYHIGIQLASAMGFCQETNSTLCWS